MTSYYQQQKITASDAANDEFGTAVSVSGDYAIVGAEFLTQILEVSPEARTFTIVRGHHGPNKPSSLRQTRLHGNILGRRYPFQVTMLL
mmetsp:Transcript_3951/g.13735  ORF Transcript_3951/g.13735 Transcript_3951/m.13735 type:complete len:89 (+) Transcript_3951:482-748(+)